jgi:hypothetical protein
MSARTTDRVFLGTVIPANYKASLLDRAEREDRSMSSVVRSALAAFLFDDRPVDNKTERKPWNT